MLVPKAALYKTLRALQKFDSAGAPYIGMQWGADALLFHRSGSTGYIESLGFKRDDNTLIVSLDHFVDTLAGMNADMVEVATDRNRILSLVGTYDSGTDDLRVNTIRQNVTWAKQHDVGEESVEVPTNGFQGINTGPFEMTSPPVLRRNKLMLPTTNGIVIRNEVPVEAYPYPRDGFLRTISNLAVERLYLTRNGYWGAVAGGLRILIAGHRAGDQVFDLYSVGATPVQEFAADRLLNALKSASDLAAEASYIQFSPRHGVQARNQYNQTNTYTLGDTGTWSPIAIRPRTARVVYNALVQTKEETVIFSQVNADTMRFTRGAWDVSFKIFPSESTKGNSGR